MPIAPLPYIASSVSQNVITNYLISVPKTLHFAFFFDCYIHGIIYHVTFCLWLPLLTLLSRFIDVVVYISS